MNSFHLAEVRCFCRYRIVPAVHYGIKRDDSGRKRKGLNKMGILLTNSP